MRYFAKLFAYVSVLSLASLGSLVYAQLGPYRGRVIDAETKQPIEGAAVLVIWRQRSGYFKGVPLPHPSITYHDAQETLTDLNGNFTVPGILGIPTEAAAEINEPEFIIFKPGYEAYGGWSLKAKRLPGAIQLYEKDGLTVIELGRLTTREQRLENLRRLSSFSSCLPEELAEKLKMPADLPYCIPQGKHPNLIRLRDIEEESLGLPPRRPRKGAQQ